MKICNVIWGPKVEYNYIDIKEAIDKYIEDYGSVNYTSSYYVIDDELYNNDGVQISNSSGVIFEYRNMMVEYIACQETVFYAMGGTVLKLNVNSVNLSKLDFYGRLYRRAESVYKLMLEDYRFSAI